VLLFQPTTTTFKFPVVCAELYVTETLVGDDCGVVEFTWTKEMAADAVSESAKQTRIKNAANFTGIRGSGKTLCFHTTDCGK
jgi:hypothetical protein